MHIDATGAAGMKFQPYYPEDIIDGEKQAFHGLPTKNTFVKIHGWGRIIFQSYSVLEKQGSNLVVEIVERALKIFMNATNRSKIRNLYIFLDNTNSNKSHSLITSLSALVLAGESC